MSVKLIAELSMNHLGDKNLIEKMVEAAAWSGADFVKFQTWKVKNLAKGEWDNDERREQYKKAEMTDEKIQFILSCCKKYSIEFLTSCFNVEDLDFVRKYSNKIKIPGPESSNKPLMEKALAFFDDVYMSTGASKEEEFIHYTKYKHLCIMHCVSAYPCLPENANMGRMCHFRTFTENIGYSGHCLGIWDAIMAISLGAKVVEKHFTIDKNLEFRDNAFSILPQEMKSIKEYANDFEKMIIPHGIDCQDCESKIRNIYARRWCNKG